jgi:LemA protein
MNNILTAFLAIIIFIGIIAIIYIFFYNSLQEGKIRINESESIIDELLRKKYDLLNLIKDVIIDEVKISDKVFNEYKKIKEMNISSFDFERKLTEYNNLINKIKNDYDTLNNDTRFNNYYEEIYQINEKLEASKSFYNKYTSILNKSIKRFPSNIIAFIHHIKVQPFFDGKDMFDDDIKDFKL